MACLPELPVDSVQYLAEGWDSTAFEVNGELVFRFPKRADVAAALRREERLLPAIESLIPVPVPRFIRLVAACGESAWPFAGYRKLPGVQLSATTLDEGQALRLAEDTGRFLAALHAFPLEWAASLRIPSYQPGGKRTVRAFLRLARAQTRPLLAQHERRQLARWIAGLEATLTDGTEKVLVHGDLAGEHLLLERETGRLAGVIDFGDVGMGDPALDFAGLLNALGEERTRTAIAAYGRQDDEALLGRGAAFAAMAPLHEVTFGLHTGAMEHVDHGLEVLRSGPLR